LQAHQWNKELADLDTTGLKDLERLLGVEQTIFGEFTSWYSSRRTSN